MCIRDRSVAVVASSWVEDVGKGEVDLGSVNEESAASLAAGKDNSKNSEFTIETRYKLLNWLEDIQLVKRGAATIAEFPSYCRNGVLLGDLILRLEGVISPDQIAANYTARNQPNAQKPKRSQSQPQEMSAAPGQVREDRSEVPNVRTRHYARQPRSHMGANQ
eukprot:TRINITY_DN12203_c0_g1_i1.p1 TRINITY_DN12203_c0_g1~~TRINITY_DN12203_c0_g1_i1.p1  ORF type:complete len:163 (+),score=16.30 TRINITY_DN12203_c0_g1_i1:65-553(+)